VGNSWFDLIDQNDNSDLNGQQTYERRGDPMFPPKQVNNETTSPWPILKGKTKPYQVKQLLKIIEKHNLNMESSE